MIVGTKLTKIFMIPLKKGHAIDVPSTHNEASCMDNSSKGLHSFLLRALKMNQLSSVSVDDCSQYEQQLNWF
jgi:hypothetical protein